jgi:hypothetical protein
VRILECRIWESMSIDKTTHKQHDGKHHAVDDGSSDEVDGPRSFEERNQTQLMVCFHSSLGHKLVSQTVN